MLSDWLKSALDTAGMGQSMLAKELTSRLGRSIDRAAVNKMTKGQRHIKGDEMIAIAEITGVPAPTDADTPQPTTVVPLVSWVSAGELATVETIPEGEQTDTVVTTNLGPGRWVALHVEGDSMNQVAPDGSRIFINRDDTELVSGKCYVIADELGRATFKRYRATPVPRFEPDSSNREHEPYFPPPGGAVKVIGRVRKIVHDLD